VRYYGLYSNAPRGKERKAGEDTSHPSLIAEENPSVCRKGWAEMIKKQFFFDCPQICYNTSDCECQQVEIDQK